MKKYKDFDKFFEETMQDNYVTVKVFGKEYDIKAELPATVVLAQYRSFKEGAETSGDQQAAMAIEIIGEDILQEWADKGLSQKKLSAIVEYIVNEIMGKADEDETDDSAKKK